VFTLNNYTPEEVESLKICGSKYLIFGKEIGDSGTPHLQGYMWFPTLKSLKQVKSINPRAHWEQQKGSFERFHKEYQELPIKINPSKETVKKIQLV